ncbi:hypothetical protein ZWY2020_019512 [Hordeum vulgare]|nr:hypothetical protein ZWY2020_019512 [Hordeum vulgare]
MHATYLDFHVDLRLEPPYGSEPQDHAHVILEILDRSGEHVSFHRGEMVSYAHSFFESLSVTIQELEAASCIHDTTTSFTLRCTVSYKLPESKLRRWCRRIRGCKPEGAVMRTESRVIAVDDFSRMKAASGVRECAHSTSLIQGWNVWEVGLYPSGYNVCDQATLSLTRRKRYAGREDSPATTLRFRFELHAGLYGRKFYESSEVTHVFDGAICEHMTQVTMATTSIMDILAGDDRLVIRWFFVVLPAVPLSVPATTVLPTAPLSEAEESVFTPLL